jgi:hypothetical protein
MNQVVTQSGITFTVDAVAPATTRRGECRAHEAVKKMVDSEIESCSDYHATVVKDIHYQPLLAAVYLAFSEHRPLVLTPDAVWITIAQGVAHHMAIHGERLRSRFVSHQGKLELIYKVRDWVDGSPENPWPDAFASWAGQIRDHVGPAIHDVLACDFSTTGPVERAVGNIVMMDVFERYFEYVLYCVCGIPTITLEGTSADWARVREKAEGLRIFDMDWWLAHLLPICDQFVRASRGDIDLQHWQNICKLRKEYGGDVINGWVAKLFPYLRAFIRGPCSRRNPIFETGEGFQTLDAPPGLSRVPFKWVNLATGGQRAMEAIGGLVGVTQDDETMALRPKVGWAVREARRMDVLLARLAGEHTTFPASTPIANADEERPLRSDLPADLGEFYHRTNGAELFGRGPSAGLRIVPREQMEPLNWGEDLARMRGSAGPGGRVWHRFAWLPDGSWLAINLDVNIHLATKNDAELKATRPRWDQVFTPILHGSRATQGRDGMNPVVAWSFEELLARLLDSSGKPYWLDPTFKTYGDAARYTRRM